MTKRQEIDDPKSCLNKGPDDRLKFVIDATDVAAPATIREWCRLRCNVYGKNTPRDAQISEALAWADRAQDGDKCSHCGGPLNEVAGCRNQCAGSGRD